MEDLRVDTAFVQVPGGTVFVQTWKPDTITLPPIILLHDSLGCVELWRDFPAALARRLQAPVIAYDRLGFGHSTARRELPSGDFIREEAEIVFPVLLQALSINEYVLFGHSVGGAMALTIAASADQQCQAVISESAQAFVEERTLNGIRAAQAQFNDPDHLARLTRWHGDKAIWVLQTWIETWLTPEFASWSLDADLPNVDCPVLAIHGENDEYGSVAFPQRIVSRVSGPAQMVLLSECGHVPHRERRNEILHLVEHALKGDMFP